MKLKKVIYIGFIGKTSAQCLGLSAAAQWNKHPRLTHPVKTFPGGPRWKIYPKKTPRWSPVNFHLSFFSPVKIHSEITASPLPRWISGKYDPARWKLCIKRLPQQEYTGKKFSPAARFSLFSILFTSYSYWYFFHVYSPPLKLKVLSISWNKCQERYSSTLIFGRKGQVTKTELRFRP